MRQGLCVFGMGAGGYRGIFGEFSGDFQDVFRMFSGDFRERAEGFPLVREGRSRLAGNIQLGTNSPPKSEKSAQNLTFYKPLKDWGLERGR